MLPENQDAPLNKYNIPSDKKSRCTDRSASFVGAARISRAGGVPL